MNPKEEMKMQGKEDNKDSDSDSTDEPEIAPNVRIATLGNVDSGKSTLTGLLTSAPGELDDGKGLMR